MNFTEPAFLFLFLPCLLVANFTFPRRLRNLLLMLASLLFYGIGEPAFVPVLVAACLFNYGAAIGVERCRGTRGALAWLVLAIVGNLALLAVFKYCSFAVSSLHSLLGLIGMRPRGFPRDWPIPLPLGISFFTFHAISYVVDVYRGTNHAERNPLDVILYVTLFPQLIAGPIIRYHDIAQQLKSRSVRFTEFTEGIGRFVVGLGKKMLIANTVAVAVDGIFEIPAGELTTSLAWLGIVCYTIQIYYDFSGYSDMAIGLGLMFGFRFLENFNYPYISGSITEFWRRWHISLSNWFRDYLYIPLGGNRGAPWQTYLNLVIVFFLCGLWHGASSKFVVWGIYHGLFLVIERLASRGKRGLTLSGHAVFEASSMPSKGSDPFYHGMPGVLKWLIGTRNPFKHVYALLVVSVGWVLFRAPTFEYAMHYLSAMAGFARGSGLEHQVGLYADRFTWIILGIACIGAMPVIPALQRLSQSIGSRPTIAGQCFKVASETTVLFALAGCFIVSVTLSAAGTYNPFIYFQF